MAFSGAEPQTYVYTDISYNLETWFNRNLNILSIIYVNGVPLTPGQAQNYTFIGNEGDRVDVTLQDNFDSTCRLTKTFTLAGCSLVYSQGPIISEYPPSSQLYYFKVKDHFSGTNADTIYKLIITYRTNNDDIVNFGPVDIRVPFGIPENDPLLPLVPVEPNRLKTLYQYNAINYPQGIPLNVPEGNYLSVTFTARNSNQCTAGTPNFNTDDNPANTQYVLVGGFKFAGGSNTACDLEFPNKSVYIVEQTPLPTQTQILSDGIPIYADGNGSTPADPGVYATTQLGQNNTVLSIWREWNGSSWVGQSPTNC